MDTSFRLLPNPSRALVNLHLDTPLSREAEERVYDLAGRQVDELVLAAGSNGQTMATDRLTNGIYLVQLHTGERVLNQKLVVAH